jgi:hypothetical protein
MRLVRGEEVVDFRIVAAFEIIERVVVEGVSRGTQIPDVTTFLHYFYEI